jgi:hypothetical protein
VAGTGNELPTGLECEIETLVDDCYFPVFLKAQHGRSTELDVKSIIGDGDA